MIVGPTKESKKHQSPFSIISIHNKLLNYLTSLFSNIVPGVTSFNLLPKNNKRKH